MKLPMNLAMACAATLLMGGVSAHAATTSQSSNQSAEAICATADGAQDPMCQKAGQDDEANLARWGRGGWHRGGWHRGPWGRGPIRRGWCYYHPYAPRCR